MKTKRIKIALLLTAIVFAANSPVSARLIRTTKFNPSSQGTYKDIHETHGLNDHNLSCQNPGEDACVWEISPWSKVHVYDFAANHVQDAIENNNMFGSMPIEDGTLTWHATSPNDYWFELNVTTE